MFGQIEYMPFRENYGLLPAETSLIMYIVLIPFALIFFYGVCRGLKVYGYSALVKMSRNPGRWFREFFRYSLLQLKIIREVSAGFMHIFVSYSIFVLFIGTLLVFIDSDILEPFKQKLLQGSLYLVFEFTLDLFGLMFLAGITLQLIRRAGVVKRLKPRLEYYGYLFGLLFIGLTGFILEGMRIYLTKPSWSSYSFIGETFSLIFSSIEASENTIATLYAGFWWAHALTAFMLIGFLPYTNLRHIIVSPIYAGLSYDEPRLPLIAKTPFRLEEIDVSKMEEVEIGFRKIGDLDWYRKMGFEACTDCGRCEASCPAYISGTPLSPRNMIQKLDKILWKRKLVDEDLFQSRYLTYEEVYACTTCGACVYVCPVMISPLEYLIEARRSLVMEGRLEKKASETLNNIMKTGNPFGLPRRERDKLVEELKSIGARTIQENPDPEYVYWIGCLAVYDTRVRSIAKKMVEVMCKAGLNFAILGSLEECTGEPARRIGEEGLFQEQAYKNIETFKKFSIRKLVVHCPHCFQVFKNEYREFGLNIEVLHHTQILKMLVEEGKIKPSLKNVVTLHDSCYLSRYNKIVKEPRKILESLELREMERCREDTFCCGGGGGNYWSEVRRTVRESLQRVEEAVKIGAEVIITECPYCLMMLEDAVRVAGLEEKIKVLDISEIF
ncbi:MAG: (Fe-S)-binding protein [Nitrososphaerota archaeon]